LVYWLKVAWRRFQRARLGRFSARGKKAWLFPATRQAGCHSLAKARWLWPASTAVLKARSLAAGEPVVSGFGYRAVWHKVNHCIRFTCQAADC
jgi:hypothetical protein